MISLTLPVDTLRYEGGYCHRSPAVTGFLLTNRNVVFRSGGIVL
jgi:hypothetical protein